MKLQKSKLCVNCESIYEQHAPCPFCGSEIFVWLSRALGTALEESVEETEACILPMKRKSTLKLRDYPAGAQHNSFGERDKGSKSLAEFRLACGRVGREMVRVLTLGLGQACK
jgi:hypothetical protein